MQSRKEAGIKLLIWMIFLGIILIPFVISDIKTSKNSTNQNQNININNTDSEIIYNNEIYKNIVEKLNKYNYEYKFIITKDNQKTIYFGKILYDEVLGYKEENDTITKYYINENTIYDNINKNNILGDINSIEYDKLLDFNNIFSLIENMNYTQENKKINFTDDLLDISISDDNDMITLSILKDNVEYTLNYYNINKLNTIE